MEYLSPLIGMNLAELESVAAGCGMPRYAARQMADWLYQKRVAKIDDMTNLSKRARATLAEVYCTGREEPLKRVSAAAGTVKYLFRGARDRDVEAVMIPDHDRCTLCVSSQAGCRMNCAFCMTGRQGFHGNLSAAQIINQILSVEESESLTNVVFMGMGEPTDNLDAVVRAIEILTATWGLAWSPKRITVSTVGRPDGIRRLLDMTKVHLALSVHSPFGSERADMMPVERAYPVAEVIELLRGHDFAHQRRLSVEYTMMKGKNDDIRHADALARLLRGTDARVNLIRFHPVPGYDEKAPEAGVMTAFRDRLNALGITATIRASRGEDIDAACGMLAGKEKKG